MNMPQRSRVVALLGQEIDQTPSHSFAVTAAARLVNELFITTTQAVAGRQGRHQLEQFERFDAARPNFPHVSARVSA